MVNIATLILTHGLMVVMVWRLVFRDDLDSDPPAGGEDGEPGGA
ncbi:MAG: hypothetical protein ABGW84_12075 [Sphingomonadaceae bacterium]|jgi:hypothetical protein